MAKLPDKFSIAKPVVIDAVNGHPVRPVDVNGIALDDATVQYSVAHPVVEVDTTGTVISDATRVFSMAKKVRISPTGTPIIVTDPTGVPTGGTLSGGTFTPTMSFDTRFGTTDTSTGFITFPLNSGNRRVWVDSTKADDTGNGLTAATAKKTWDAAFAVFIGSGFNPGDQLMVAGGAGQTYTDNGLLNWANSSYPSSSSTGYQYPTAVLSYDSTDSTNTTKYGKLTGTKMPVVTIASAAYQSPSLACNGDTFTNHYAIQGIELKGIKPASALLFGGVHDGIVFQNMRFNRVGVSINPSNSGVQNVKTLLSKCAFWGIYNDFASSGPNGILIGDMNGYRQEDCVFIHCGWNVGAGRDNTQANGGANFFQHGFYYHAANLGGVFNRNLCMDNGADGHNYRGPATVTCAVAIDEPIAITFGGYSGSYTEAPGGILSTLNDFVILGGTAMQPVNFPVYVGFNINATIAGSYARNGVMADLGLTGNRYFTAKNPNPLITSTCLIDKIRGLNYGGTSSNLGDIPSDVGTLPTIHISNSQLDFAVASPFTSDGGNSISSGAGLPLAKTKNQLITALGFSNKAQMVNMMLWRPDIQWAAVINSIILPAYGLTLSAHPSVSLPSLVGETPATIYPTALVDLTLSATFIRGTASKAVLVGCGANSTFSASGLPSGFTLLGTELSYDGTGTGALSTSFSVTETSLDGLGSHTTAAVSLSIAAPTLGAVTLSSTSFTNGVPSNGTINGTTSGSTLTTTGMPASITINSAARTWNYDGTGSGSGSFTLTETLTGATNTPRANTISYSIAGSRGANLLLSANIFKGSGVTGADTDGTHYTGGTLTAPANTNILADWSAPLTASTSYTLTFNYTLASGGSLKATDGGNTLGTPPTLTTDNSPHSATYTFTTPATLAGSGWIQMSATGGLLGGGTITSIYLSTP